MENFSAKIEDICNNPNISDDLKIQCDQGSLGYCTDTANPTNIITQNCKSYLDRVCKTVTAEKTNQPYANPIKVSKGKKPIDHYNALVESVNTYSKSNIETSEFNDLMKIFLANNIDKMPTDAMFERAKQYCLQPTADQKFCQVTDPNQSWFVKALSGPGMNIYIQNATDLVNKKKTINIYDDATLVKLNTKYPTLFKSVESIFLKGLTLEDRKSVV